MSFFDAETDFLRVLNDQCLLEMFLHEKIYVQR